MTFEHDSEHADDRLPALAGHAVIDSHLQRVGTVTDVLFDEREQMPRWAVVKTGVVSGEHFVPLARTYVDQDGRLVVPHDKASIKRAPRARRDHILTREIARKLSDYYSMAA
jgi:sporulation protein YlmC with PRC-barrel domain